MRGRDQGDTHGVGMFQLGVIQGGLLLEEAECKQGKNPRVIQSLGHRVIGPEPSSTSCNVDLDSIELGIQIVEPGESSRILGRNRVPRVTSRRTVDQRERVIGLTGALCFFAL